MNDNTILLFTRNGLGDAPAELQQKLAVKFLQLTLEANALPAKPGELRILRRAICPQISPGTQASRPTGR